MLDGVTLYGSQFAVASARLRSDRDFVSRVLERLARFSPPGRADIWVLPHLGEEELWGDRELMLSVIKAGNATRVLEFLREYEAGARHLEFIREVRRVWGVRGRDRGSSLFRNGVVVTRTTAVGGTADGGRKAGDTDHADGCSARTTVTRGQSDAERRCAVQLATADPDPTRQLETVVSGRGLQSRWNPSPLERSSRWNPSAGLQSQPDVVPAGTHPPSRCWVPAGTTPELLTDDPVFFLRAMETAGDLGHFRPTELVQFASPRLRENKQFMLEVIVGKQKFGRWHWNPPPVLRWTDEDSVLRADPELVLEDVNRCNAPGAAKALEFAADELRNDDSFMLEGALPKSSEVLKYLSRRQVSGGRTTGTTSAGTDETVATTRCDRGQWDRIVKGVALAEGIDVAKKKSGGYVRWRKRVCGAVPDKTARKYILRALGEEELGCFGACFRELVFKCCMGDVV